MKTTIFAMLLAITLIGCAPAPAATSLPPAPTATSLPPTVTPASTATSIPPTMIPTNTPESTNTAKAPTIDVPKLSAEIDTLFQQLVKENRFSGSVLVAQNGQVILSKGYGFADSQKKILNTAQTKFQLASITKQFTAMAIMMLQEQGKLSVQDKLCKYLTDCPGAWQPITLHQLLTHTSGIPNNIDFFITQEITSSVPLEQMIADAKTKPLDFPPGDHFSYTDVGYSLLGKIIEAVSGQPYGGFLQKNIFEPLQMSNTGFDPHRDDVAVGYKTGDYTATADPRNIWVAFSSGGLYSTVEDLYRWDQALYTSKLVPQQVLDTMFKAYVVIPDSGGLGWGYGWMISPVGAPRWVAHYGNGNGITTFIVRELDIKATIIILGNMESIDIDTPSNSVAKMLFGK